MRALAVLAIVVVASMSHAQPAPSGGLRDEAVRLFESQDYAGAADAFARCYQVERDPACLYGQGQAYRMAGDCTRAIAAYRAFLRTSPASEPRQKALLNLAACEQSAAGAPLPPPKPQPAASVSRRSIEAPWYRDRPGVVLAVAAVAAGTAGATFFVLSNRARDAAEREGRGDGALQAFDDHLSRADRHRFVGVVAVSAGAALALGAALRFALHDRTTTVTVSTSSYAGTTTRWITFASAF